MKRNRAIAVVALLAVLIMGTAFLALRPREPVYQGKPLSEWIDRLGVGTDEQIQVAEEAVRRIGTNGLPALIRMIDSEDSWLKKKIMQLAQKQSLLSVPLVSGRIDQFRAVNAFHVLGAEAKPASSDLLKLVENGPDPVRSYALSALADVGPDARAVPTLVCCLKDHTRADYTRFKAAIALGTMRSKAEIAIPELLAALRDRNDDVRCHAAWALAQINRESNEVVPALTELLNDADSRVRNRAAVSLGEFGTNAKAAIPALLRLLNDPQVGISASIALKQIDPEATARSRVK
ncbi:MAG: hypothetical protein DME19_16230 [Verrucomicrobia bacterium]|nr:MAG: hypothetical protein DME19_16230 [Verrucomicrobiota bacterium]